MTTFRRKRKLNFKTNILNGIVEWKPKAKYLGNKLELELIKTHNAHHAQFVLVTLKSQITWRVYTETMGQLFSQAESILPQHFKRNLKGIKL